MNGHTIVQVPGIGDVEFPSTMSDEAIVRAIQGMSPQLTTSPLERPQPTTSAAADDFALSSVPFRIPQPDEIEQSKTTFDKAADFFHMPAEGIKQAGRGARTITQWPEEGKRAAFSDVIEGSGKALLPFLPTVAAAGPAAVAKGFAVGIPAMFGAGKVADWRGWEPETKRLVENVAAGAPIGKGALTAISKRRMLNQMFRQQQEAAVSAAKGDVGAKVALESITQAMAKLEAAPSVIPPSHTATLIEQRTGVSGVRRSAPEAAETLYQIPQVKSAIESASILERAPRLEKDAGAVRKGGFIHPAAQAAETIAAVPDIIAKSARESAKVIERTLTTREQQRLAKQMKANVRVPETGVAERTARVMDARERIARETTGKEWKDLTNSERITVDQLIVEGHGFSVGSERGGIEVPVAEIRAWIGGKREGAKAAGGRFKSQWVDKFDPIRQLVKSKSLSPEQDPYIGARMYAGHVGKVDLRLQGLREILRPAAKEKLLDKVVKHALYERYEELAIPVPGSRNVARVKGITEFPGGKTIDQLRAEKIALERSMTPEELVRVQQISKDIRAYSKQLVDESHEAGLISDESYAHLSQAENRGYMPLQRLEKLADELESGRIRTGANAFSVATQNLYKGIRGSEKEILSPLEGMIRNTYKTVAQAERNKVATKMANLASDPDFEGVVIKLSGEHPHVPKGMDTFHVLRKGIKEDYAAPKSVVDSLKGLNDQQIDMATQLARLSSSALRAGATSMNMAFFIPNMVRDAQTAKLVSQVGFSLADWGRGFGHAIRRSGEFKDFMKQGGSFSGFFERHGGTQKTLKHLTESPGRKVLRKVVNPVELMRIVGETTELAPRLGVFARSKRMGMTPYQAAFNARNATIDFAKMGSKMRVANMWIPFLNARLQGTLNTAGAIRRNPKEAGKVLGYVVGLPAVATYLNNRAFHSDAWKDIAQFEKDNYFIFIYGDRKDKDGNYTDILKIPKGDVGRIFGNVIENLLEYRYGDDPKGAKELALEILSDASPIDFEREGKFSGQRALSGVLPPAARAVGEVATDTKWYFDRPITPFALKGGPASKQYTESTPPWLIKGAHALGKVTQPTLGKELSPLQAGHLIEAQLGGLGRQITKGDPPYKAIGRRFFGAFGGGEESKAHERLTDLQTEEKGQKIDINREAKRLYGKLNELPASERQAQAKKALSGNPNAGAIVRRIVDLIKGDAIDVTSLEKRLKGSTSVGVRARFLYETLEPLAPDLRGLKYAEWKKKRIITDAVEKEFRKLVALADLPPT
jgi:hypothetical protein